MPNQWVNTTIVTQNDHTNTFIHTYQLVHNTEESNNSSLFYQTYNLGCFFVPMEPFPKGTLGHFPQKSQQQESRATQP